MYVVEYKRARVSVVLQRLAVSSVLCTTGVLESLERDEAKSLIERHGGRVTTTISKKTNHIVIGREAGESKLAKVRHPSTGNFMYIILRCVCVVVSCTGVWCVMCVRGVLWR